MGRIAQLDALRGLMAVVVALLHIFLTFPNDYAQTLKIIQNSPLRVLIVGHAAVLVFFVMSGFVLALPFLNGRRLVVGEFLIRRFTRLYPPYAASILIAAILLAHVGPGHPNSISSFFDGFWETDPSPMVIALHLLGAGRQMDVSLNYPIWSLVVEIRVAILFPLLLLLTTRWRWASVIGGGLVLLLADFVLPIIGQGPEVYTAALSWTGSLLITARYLIFFIVGIVMAATVGQWSPAIQRLPWIARGALVASSLILLSAPSTINFLSDWIIGAGAVGVVALTVALGERSALLNSAPVQWLGRVSFSFYLIHMPVWLAWVYVFADRIGLVATALLFPLVLIPAAEIMYRLVEQPSIDIGRRLARRHADAERSTVKPA